MPRTAAPATIPEDDTAAAVVAESRRASVGRPREKRLSLQTARTYGGGRASIPTPAADDDTTPPTIAAGAGGAAAPPSRPAPPPPPRPRPIPAPPPRTTSDDTAEHTTIATVKELPIERRDSAHRRSMLTAGIYRRTSRTPSPPQAAALPAPRAGALVAIENPLHAAAAFDAPETKLSAAVSVAPSPSPPLDRDTVVDSTGGAPGAAIIEMTASPLNRSTAATRALVTPHSPPVHQKSFHKRTLRGCYDTLEKIFSTASHALLWGLNNPYVMTAVAGAGATMLAIANRDSNLTADQRQKLYQNGFLLLPAAINQLGDIAKQRLNQADIALYKKFFYTSVNTLSNIPVWLVNSFTFELNTAAAIFSDPSPAAEQLGIPPLTVEVFDWVARAVLATAIPETIRIFVRNGTVLFERERMRLYQSKWPLVGLLVGNASLAIIFGAMSRSFSDDPMGIVRKTLMEGLGYFFGGVVLGLGSDTLLIDYIGRLEKSYKESLAIGQHKGNRWYHFLSATQGIIVVATSSLAGLLVNWQCLSRQLLFGTAIGFPLGWRLRFYTAWREAVNTRNKDTLRQGIRSFQCCSRPRRDWRSLINYLSYAGRLAFFAAYPKIYDNTLDAIGQSEFKIYTRIPLVTIPAVMFLTGPWGPLPWLRFPSLADAASQPDDVWRPGIPRRIIGPAVRGWHFFSVALLPALVLALIELLYNYMYFVPLYIDTLGDPLFLYPFFFTYLLFAILTSLQAGHPLLLPTQSTEDETPLSDPDTNELEKREIAADRRDFELQKQYQRCDDEHNEGLTAGETSKLTGMPELFAGSNIDTGSLGDCPSYIDDLPEPVFSSTTSTSSTDDFSSHSMSSGSGSGSGGLRQRLLSLSLFFQSPRLSDSGDFTGTARLFPRR